MRSSLTGAIVRAAPQLPHLKAVLTRPPPPALAAQHAVLKVLSEVRVKAAQNVEKAALDSFRRHYLALKPITLESARSGEYLKQRATARHAFVHEALGAQLAEIEKVLAQLKAPRASPAQAPLHKHFDWLKARYEKRIAELKKAMAAPAAANMQVPLHLLPRSFAVPVAAVR